MTDESTAREGTDDGGTSDPGALLSRLRVIEDQPLATRAHALAQLHDELRSQLEAPHRDG